MFMINDYARLISEINKQDGTDVDAEELTEAEWAKVDAREEDYGSPVTITFKTEGGSDFDLEPPDPITDYGYLTCLPDREGDWDMVGIVHIPKPWVEKERPIAEWHSLYSLCKNPLIAKIVIGSPPR